jgi:hypothetical protein
VPDTLEHGWLLGGDVQEHERRSIRIPAIRLPRLHEFGADVEVARKHCLRRMERCPQSLHRSPGTTDDRLSRDGIVVVKESDRSLSLPQLHQQVWIIHYRPEARRHSAGKIGL